MGLIKEVGYTFIIAKIPLLLQMSHLKLCKELMCSMITPFNNNVKKYFLDIEYGRKG